MSELRHFGYDANTKRKYVVVFRQLPEDSSSALVVETATLEERYHDGLITAAESSEAQSTNDLYEVLNRTLFFDGKNILSSLHTMKKLKKVSVAEVMLSPEPGKEVSLSAFNKAVGDARTKAEEVTGRPSEVGLGGADVNELTGQARNLIIQAQLLEEDARKKRAEAEQLNPGINDKTKRPRGRPKKDAPASPLDNTVEAEAKVEAKVDAKAETTSETTTATVKK
jgi:hypothetical protein